MVKHRSSRGARQCTPLDPTPHCGPQCMHWDSQSRRDGRGAGRQQASGRKRQDSPRGAWEFRGQRSSSSPHSVPAVELTDRDGSKCSWACALAGSLSIEGLTSRVQLGIAWQGHSCVRKRRHYHYDRRLWRRDRVRAGHAPISSAPPPAAATAPSAVRTPPRQQVAPARSIKYCCWRRQGRVGYPPPPARATGAWMSGASRVPPPPHTPPAPVPAAGGGWRGGFKEARGSILDAACSLARKWLCHETHIASRASPLQRRRRSN